MAAESSDISLLFRIRADAAGVKTATAEARAAVAQLRQSFGPELAQTVSLSNKTFSDLANNLSQFVGQRIPLVGNAFASLTNNLKGVSTVSAGSEKALASVGRSIESIATASGKTVPQIASFLTNFVKLETQAKRDASAIEFFGASMATKLLPQLERAGAGLATVSAESAAAGTALRAFAHPVALVVVAVAAATIGIALLGKELFEISKRAAEAQGRMFDLAQQTGVAVETLSALEIAAKTTGGEIGNITQALVTFQRRLDDTSDPASKAAAQFKELGIQTLDTETALRQAFASLARMPQGFQQTNAAAELFGARGGKQILAILKETNGDLDGAIKRFRELGILIEEGDAQAADKLNDELALLDFQLRSLGFVLARDLIPELTGLVKAFSDLLRAGKPVLGLIGDIGGPTVRAATSSLRGLGTVVQILTLDFAGLKRSIKEANEEAAKSKDIPPLTTEGPRPTELPGEKTPKQQAQEAAAAADIVVAAVKRTAATNNQALEQLFEQGRVNRQKQVDETIENNRQILKAETDRIDALIAAKQKEFKAIDRERLSKAEVVAQEIKLQQDADKLNQDRLDKEAEFGRESTRLRARAAQERASSLRSQIDNETNILVKEFEAQINAIEAAIARGATPETEGLTTIEALEKAKIDARIEGLEKQKLVGFLTIQEGKELNSQIDQLNQERDQLEEEQQQRRLARERVVAERVRDIHLANIDAILEVEQTRAEQLIAANEALAAARVLSEEDAARRVLAIRLRLIEAETEATKIRLNAAASITDVNERTRTEADLNNRLKVLTEQRVSIQDQGNRDIDAGRQQDLKNEKEYADELERIRERIVRTQRETARTVIDLMILNFAKRKDIIRAQLDLDLNDEATRHKSILDAIKEDQRSNDARVRVLNNLIATLKAAGKETSAEYQKAVDELRAANEKKAELHQEEEAELERSEAEKERIRREAAKAAALAGPGGGFVEGLNTGQLTELKNGVQEFADIARVAFSAVGAVVNQLASGIGNLVQNFVLLGSNGPNAFRKLVASVLAGVAAQAATLAIMELAYGIAALTPWGAAIYGPAAAHFKAAALFGSVALATGLVGRQVAGGLFAPTGAGGSAGGSDSQTGVGQLNPLALERNTTQTQIIRHEHVFQIQSNDSHIVKVVGKNFQDGGEIREIVLNDGAFVG